MADEEKVCWLCEGTHLVHLQGDVSKAWWVLPCPDCTEGGRQTLDTLMQSIREDLGDDA